MDAIAAAPRTILLGTCCLLYFVVYPIIVYFHDAKGLRKFPNMHPLSGISSIPFMIVAHGGARSTYLSQLHKKHAVIRTGPNTLSYADTRAIRDIYGHSTKCTKDALYALAAGSHFHLADVINKPDHARKRKVLSSAYALKNLEGWEHKVADTTARLIAHFDKCCTAPMSQERRIPDPADLKVDYRAWTNFFTIDAIADIGLSEKFGLLDAGHDRVIGRRTNGTTYQCNFRDCLDQTGRKQSLLIWPYEWYPLINKIANVIPFYGRMGKFATDWDGIPLELAHRRLERYRAGEQLDDFFQALMEDKNGKPNNLEWGEIVAEISIMMNAGSATTAIAMANVMYQLLKNPKVMKILVNELDAALGDDDDDDEPSQTVVVPYDRVKHLPYLRACLDESLRLAPPNTQSLSRETPPGGTDIMGDYVAGGVTVGISALVAHRIESVFPQADQFIPERWLGEEGKNLQPYFLAFSTGARGCIGRNISYLEQTVLLASVLRRYEFALPHPQWEIQRLETMNWLLGEMPVKVWKRKRPRI
ncbi:cytochrome P450 oxidoreductase [Capronia epimyces CBS 606.96]|uniref:Cytochrome P450 oxidoreductase n=1 Tax=Capronia epimyces CBS 606.96 TaxID=1182542 RepID=W9YRA9_9EURO|nr:cytochrome P450 oxidoreductase [Capronia epimyces CBS 606.96]EXJ92210.1 cytochrome P450 oxidoreductase [Capronia epimyces CBS 606.96]